jgi:hypothetical protein
MTATSTSFKSERAPCGRLVDGDHYQDQDDEGMVTDHLHYACGCRSTRHDYHDGSTHRLVVRHDGKVLMDELLAAH